MATCNVSVEFWCEFGATELKYKHSIPKTLVTQCTVPTVDKADPTGARGSVSEGSRVRCESCGGLAKEILQSPISYLHAERPFVLVVVSSFCGKEGCEIRTRQEMQDTMAEAGQAGGNKGATQMQGQDAQSTEGKVCRVCGEMAGARRCSRCLTVAYCSRQHQKEDWKVHKKGCKPKAS
ncbi:MYND finger domain-containing protein [Hirsutella rhossiliensis]|uniref:MYND finger domain-containing protein n=1 Tax=Hirsutella rhossiliensis TaxID=111463 RepID=A0A9P8SNB0_9HYPO|nr:MYND finger domain-containing protein [Hirsutella rhossiliensis]XP_044726379.1 MYND finger domain-containing protein [Hirsutella rhossiliensis]KAH0958373.1 MYND finger domain-containing protein [Hirsutella rhossiliensis]KAH0968866.1 MYND finger domain-containing protein [Hirsutella rhossiliensis]